MSKNNINQNINSLFEGFSSSSVISSNPNPSIQNQTSSNTTINHPNTLIKSFSYQENKNLKYRQSMEDFGSLHPNLTSDYKSSLFCIYDGHGGVDVVTFIKDRIPQLIKQNLTSFKLPEDSLTLSFKKADTELRFFDSDFMGCTATAVLIIDKTTLYCANVGDSKAYLVHSDHVKQISTEHKCTDKVEAERIQKAGGKIVKGRVMGQLILSRSIGDLHVKKFGVIAEPSVSKNEINGNVRYCVIASDGVWDVVDEGMLMEVSRKGGNAEIVSKELVNIAIEKGSKDNISCIVIEF